MIITSLKSLGLVGLSILPQISAQSTTSAPLLDRLPIVDLGYQVQQANSYNNSGGYYNFSNIRFAAPPTGKNRWKAPQAPATNRSVQTGEIGRICPQATIVKWQTFFTSVYVPQYLQTGRTNWTLADFNVTSGPAPPGPQETEDCLFLDVIVSDDVFNATLKNVTQKAPVLVWFFGGGYVDGSKGDVGSPVGLLRQARSHNGQGIVYVAMNYRNGAFGFLDGPTFRQSGTPNAGLYDQRYALEWVQKHISKFGGDPKNVTVMGVSAGGGSIMHQLTAYGGSRGKVPFQKAIPQSPGWQPLVSNQMLERNYNEFLSLLNVSTLEEARSLPFATLQAANALQIYNSIYGQFAFGPTVDGNFVPRLPGELLATGRYDKTVALMPGHNADEGLVFTSPFVQNDTAFRDFVANLVPTIRAYPKVLDYVAEEMYPQIFDGSQAQNYTDQIGRAAAMVSELVFTCNTDYLNKAHNNTDYSYYFVVPPALHGSDNPYFFYQGQPDKRVLNASLAVAMQQYAMDFVFTGNPNGKALSEFGITGSGSLVQQFNFTGITRVRDPTANPRCDWWQKALYV